MEVPLLSFPSCSISRTKHTLTPELSCSQSGTSNTNQLKLTGTFHCCISDLAGRGPELGRQGCHILSHCSDTWEGCESLESRGCCALLYVDKSSTLHPAPPTAAFSSVSYRTIKLGMLLGRPWLCSVLLVSLI